MRFLTAGYPLLWSGFQLGRAPWFLLLAANMRVARAATTFALGGLMGSSGSPEALNGWMAIVATVFYFVATSSESSPDAATGESGINWQTLAFPLQALIDD